MTRDETVKIIRIMCASYPNFHPRDISETVDVWAMMLEEYPYNEVALALKQFVLTDTSGFAPSISQLIDKMATPVNEMSELEAWALVSRAISDSTYHSKERFAELPEVVQKAVGTPSNLEAWATTDIQSVENVIQSNFLRTYRAVLKREQEVAKLPPSVRALMQKEVLGIGTTKEKI